MAAGPWLFTDAGRTQLLSGTFLFGVDTFKIALFLSTSNLGPGTTTYAGVTNEVANAFGYTTGGASVTSSVSGAQTVTVDTSDATWTATGGDLIAKFAAIYEVGGNVLCYCLLDGSGVDVTATNGTNFQIVINVSGVFILA